MSFARSSILLRSTAVRRLSLLSVYSPYASVRLISWLPAGKSFDLPAEAASMKPPTVATPFASSGRLVEERVLPSVSQLDKELPSAAELKRRLANGESIDGDESQDEHSRKKKDDEEE